MDVNPELSRSLLSYRLKYLLRYVDLDHCCDSSNTVVIVMDLAILNACINMGVDKYMRNSNIQSCDDMMYISNVLPVALVEIYQHYEAWCAKRSKDLHMIVYSSSILELSRTKPYTVGLDALMTGMAFAIPNMFYIANKHIGNYDIYKVIHYYVLKCSTDWDLTHTKFLHIGCDSMAQCIQELMSYDKIITVRPTIRAGNGGKIIMENSIHLIDFLLRKILDSKSGKKLDVKWTDRLFLGRNIIGALPVLSIDSSYRLLHKIYTFDYRMQQAKSLEILLEHHNEWRTKWPVDENGFATFDKELSGRFGSSELCKIYMDIRPIYHATSIGRIVNEQYELYKNRTDDRAKIAELKETYSRNMGLVE